MTNPTYPQQGPPAGQYPPATYPQQPAAGYPPAQQHPQGYPAQPGQPAYPVSGQPAPYGKPVPAAPYGPPAPAQPAGQQYPAPQYPAQQQYPAGEAAGVYTATFVKHTGMLILWQSQTRRHRGSFEDLTRAYKEAQTHCLAAGWWSISSLLVFNWYSLIRNSIEYGKVRKAAGR